MLITPLPPQDPLNGEPGRERNSEVSQTAARLRGTAEVVGV